MEHLDRESTERENAPEAPIQEGEILAGKYRVEKVLGVGGMGVVVAAMHLELDERVAIKFLLPFAAKNPAVVARFSREARAAAKIKSQHVARVADVGALDNGAPYIVMEYLEGRDLGDLIEHEKKFSIGTAVDYVLEASEALAEAHAAGIVHRDLKPANLFLARQADGSDMIKVLDFGISKAAMTADTPGLQNQGGLTQDTEVFGSPLYMSPEQLKSSRTVDARADIWALGVLLYELITGVSPFDRPTVAETFGAILHETPRSVRELEPSVPERLETVIMRCLERDLNARFSNIGSLSRALFPFASAGNRQSLDRTSRILSRAGIRMDSAPPPPVEPVTMPPLVERPDSGNSVGTPAPAPSSTHTAWDAVDRVERARPGRKGYLVLGTATLIAAVILAVAFRNRAATRASAEPRPPVVAVAAATIQQPAPRVAVPSTAVPSPPSIAVVVSPAPSSSSEPAVEPSRSPKAKGGARAAATKLPRSGSAAAPASIGLHATPSAKAPSVPPPEAAPAPSPPKALDDPDGFGDRK